MQFSRAVKMLRIQRGLNLGRSSTIACRRSLHVSSSRYADPWPLPHTKSHMESTTSPPGAPPPEPLARPNETVEKMRARLLYQARKRGTLESDLLLSTFAKERLDSMSEEELKEFDKVRTACWGFPYVIADRRIGS